MLLKLAWRNLAGAGLRTALNVTVLSLSFIAIVGTLGLLEGFNRQTSRAMVEAEYGGGQYWCPGFDPLDPLTHQDAHGRLPDRLSGLVRDGTATAILEVPATMYAGGRLRSISINGIDPAQQLLTIPAAGLAGPRQAADDEIPILIGSRMAKAARVRIGDTVTLQWKDASGTIDAREARVAAVMRTPVQSVDVNRVWMSLDTLRDLAAMPGQATLVVLAAGAKPAGEAGGWPFRSPDDLLADVRALIRSKAVGSAVVYLMLLFLAMLAIFDTQVLSIFRRRKEIGTLIALGMTRTRVIRLFTLEGALHGALAVAAAALYGVPLLWWFSRVGWKLSAAADDYGFAVGDTLYPFYSPRLIAGTVLFLLAVTTVVSYAPTRRIASLSPTDALRGRFA